MLAIQLAAFLCLLCGSWWVSLRALWAALGVRARLRLRPSPADRFAEVARDVMARDPHILARKYADRWMVRALGVGLYDRPVWRRETGAPRCCCLLPLLWRLAPWWECQARVEAACGARGCPARALSNHPTRLATPPSFLPACRGPAAAAARHRAA